MYKGRWLKCSIHQLKNKFIPTLWSMGMWITELHTHRVTQLTTDYRGKLQEKAGKEGESKYRHTIDYRGLDFELMLWWFIWLVSIMIWSCSKVMIFYGAVPIVLANNRPSKNCSTNPSLSPHIPDISSQSFFLLT